MSRAGHAAIALVLAVTLTGPVRADDPVLAPGRDPGGTPVAVLADGFDYTRSEVAHVLARDGEGVAIAWDAVEGDTRPFAAKSGGTELALAAAARGGVRVVAVRVDGSDAASLAKGIGFAAATPAKIVLVALSGDAKTGLHVLEAAAKRFDALLIVGSVPKLALDKNAKELAPNLVLLDAGETGTAAGEAIARALGCKQDALVSDSGAALKRAFLARINDEAAAGCEPKSGAAKDEKR
ncbi:hypothetical protein [Hyphomicrobium sp. CS1GBMeth3]|uniref:hypothetical protein n=1 Tax=Hyphomicrobium sp. CS1GBMeth3 TaxID=1892845 RepID=UPI000931FB29|nr:hypothetical protein [Hyphomicrobium sp. CS1GBMeth3]